MSGQPSGSHGMEERVERAIAAEAHSPFACGFSRTARRGREPVAPQGTCAFGHRTAPPGARA